jgi:hypothetical protein
LSIESERVSVQADVTVALPLLVSALESTSHEMVQRRKKPEFDPSERVMLMNGEPLGDNKFLEP